MSVNGGLAQRLTTHPEEERYANISPDGKTLAYSTAMKVQQKFILCPLMEELLQGGLMSLKLRLLLIGPQIIR